MNILDPSIENLELQNKVSSPVHFENGHQNNCAKVNLFIYIYSLGTCLYGWMAVYVEVESAILLGMHLLHNYHL